MENQSFLSNPHPEGNKDVARKPMTSSVKMLPLDGPDPHISSSSEVKSFRSLVLPGMKGNEQSRLRMRQSAVSREHERKTLSLLQSHLCLRICFLFLFFYCFVISFIYLFWLHWVSVATPGLSLVTASRGHSLLQCKGFSLQWHLIAERRL